MIKINDKFKVVMGCQSTLDILSVTLLVCHGSSMSVGQIHPGIVFGMANRLSVSLTMLSSPVWLTASFHRSIARQPNHWPPSYLPYTPGRLLHLVSRIETMCTGNSWARNEAIVRHCTLALAALLSPAGRGQSSPYGVDGNGVDIRMAPA